jgi:hypothetical protein
VVVTGAQCFDHWFDRKPSRTREELCAQLGLRSDRPIVLYVCTVFIMGTPPEPPFVEQWLRALRASGDPLVSTANVLIRPHPSLLAHWDGIDLSPFGPVALWGSNPIDSRSRDDYFDSLFHADAVVGVNTSAFIEAGIVGREILAIVERRFHDNQEGTIHFQYLKRIGGGLLRVGRDIDDHLVQLSAALRRTPPADHPHRAFLEAFVRPDGLDRPASPTFARAVEELCAVNVPSAATTGQWRRGLLGGLVRAVARLTGESILRSPREADPVRLAQIAEAQAQQRQKP